MIFLGIALTLLGALAWGVLAEPVAGISPTAIGAILISIGIIVLIIGLILRIRRSEPGSPSTWQRIRVLPRMVRAIRARRYPAPPWSMRLLWIVGILYILSPIDLIPELLPIIGLTDDVGVGAFLLTQLRNEAGRFIASEHATTPSDRTHPPS